MKLKKKTRKRLTVSFVAFLTMMILGFVGFYIYTLDYYHADEVAKTVMKQNSNIEVNDHFTIVAPSTPSDTAVIFYPGGKVEHTAYLPILEKISQNGITCVLVDMPFNLAVFNSNAADEVFELLPDVNHWYIGGHSLGGAMASNYASKNPSKVEGLILLGAYIYGDYPPSKSLTVYGTLNSNLEEDIDYTENIVIIEGGNHAQFGNYGEQKGDPKATISREEQQNLAVEAIVKFIESKAD